jgi:hypothetical protein
MVTAFFNLQDLKPLEDYYIYIYFKLSSPSKLYLILNLYYKEIPSINLSELEL